jgi:26S proteasome regulatory subunit N13
MYSDIFDLDQLNAGGAGAAGRNARDGAGSSENAPLVSFKAGKMNLAFNAELAKYECVADIARGEVRLVWKEAGLQWQWYDRREKLVKDTVRLNNYPESTFERVDVPGKVHEQDRIYVWTKKPGEYEMYWMQDADTETDDEVVASVNQYLSDPQSAAPQGSSSGTGVGGGTGAAGAGSGTAMDTDGADASPGAGGAGAGASNSQVDALSSILENLGMPQSTAETLAASGQVGTAGGAAVNLDNRTLTLADLQGAMAGIQSATGASASGAGASASAPALSEIVTPAAITSLLEHDDVKNRLMELLPEEQRNAASLQDNLRSPQVQQTLRSLTSALLPDDDGNMDGFYSVLANFSLDPADGQAAMIAQNPIQAFLDCVLAKVEKDKASESVAGGGGGGGDDDTQESKEE